MKGIDGAQGPGHGASALHDLSSILTRLRQSVLPIRHHVAQFTYIMLIVIEQERTAYTVIRFACFYKKKLGPKLPTHSPAFYVLKREFILTLIHVPNTLFMFLVQRWLGSYC